MSACFQPHDFISHQAVQVSVFINFRHYPCDADSIDLNGYTLYVNGEVYTAGTSSKGEAVDMTVTSSGSSESHGGMPGGEKPDGMGEPPAKP